VSMKITWLGHLALKLILKPGEAVEI
jgi:hypothetical protein